MKKCILLLIIQLFILQIADAQNLYRFRLLLSEKDVTEYSAERPTEFLSEKAIERRAKYGIPIDSADFPISDIYLSQLKTAGMNIITQSKWLNSVVVECSDSLKGVQLKELSFVDSVKLVYLKELPTLETIFIRNQQIPFKDEATTIADTDKEDSNCYGQAFNQIYMHRGELLHEAGFKGNGMTIALLDAGYSNANQIEGLKNAITGYKDFTTTDVNALFGSSVSDHGTKVFSTIAANLPNQMVGTAPEASFWLLRSEDATYEFPIEEDFWAAAIEYADSLGVDIINSSLGYSNFDAPTESYSESQLDGKTAFITQVAEIAAKKGILVCSSAGNEGNSDWRFITLPSDGEHVFTIGSISKDSLIAASSSRGPTADGRIKPDIVAMGVSAYLLDRNGSIVTGSGTSFASPIMTGLMACLWQAFPDLTNLELMELVKSVSSEADLPNNVYGYGIPNMYEAYAKLITGIEQANITNTSSIEIELKNDCLFVKNQNYNDTLQPYTLRILTPQGNSVIKKKMTAENDVINLKHLEKGIYIVFIANERERFASKFVK